MVPIPPPPPAQRLRRASLAIAAGGALSALLGGFATDSAVAPAKAATAAKAAAPAAAKAPTPAKGPQILYSLETKCSLRGAAPVVCTVEALDEAGVTLYRHRIGDSVRSVRVSADPSRMEMWDGASRSWRVLRNAEARFSTNTVCFNDRDLCVVNANYLNSVLEDRPDLRGRDYVRAHFGPNGRVDLICYDGGCDLLAKRGKGVAP
ncbi:MAG: hypothetical protein VKK43_03295 [Synechococcaceae cyanobacterium]|nr:hypothetical protein [Synechococcaceae cyanobacterium]